MSLLIVLPCRDVEHNEWNSSFLFVLISPLFTHHKNYQAKSEQFAIINIILQFSNLVAVPIFKNYHVKKLNGYNLLTLNCMV